MATTTSADELYHRYLRAHRKDCSSKLTLRLAREVNKCGSGRLGTLVPSWGCECQACARKESK